MRVVVRRWPQLDNEALMSADRERRPTHDFKAPQPTKQPQVDEHAKYVEASNLLGAAADVLQHHRSDMIGAQPAVDVAALWMLLAAAEGQKDGKVIPGSERRALFDASMKTVGPAMRVYAQDEDQREWLGQVSFFV
jgi:hypothetical protein